MSVSNKEYHAIQTSNIFKWRVRFSLVSIFTVFARVKLCHRLHKQIAFSFWFIHPLIYLFITKLYCFPRGKYNYACRATSSPTAWLTRWKWQCYFCFAFYRPWKEKQHGPVDCRGCLEDGPHRWSRVQSTRSFGRQGSPSIKDRSSFSRYHRSEEALLAREACDLRSGRTSSSWSWPRR